MKKGLKSSITQMHLRNLSLTKDGMKSNIKIEIDRGNKHFCVMTVSVLFFYV